MKKKKKLVFLVLTVFFIFSCTTVPKKTTLELRTLQTREIEGDYELVFKSVMDVFQDLGYQIEETDLTSGFIRAKKDSSEEELIPRKPSKFNWAACLSLAAIGCIVAALLSKGGSSEADEGTVTPDYSEEAFKSREVCLITANVEKWKKGVTRVRINAQFQEIDQKDRVMNSKVIKTPEFYQQFFQKLHKAVFLRKQEI
jgi:hypothetical protein